VIPEEALEVVTGATVVAVAGLFRRLITLGERIARLEGRLDELDEHDDQGD
jgi:hypothetical protein